MHSLPSTSSSCYANLPTYSTQSLFTSLFLCAVYLSIYITLSRNHMFDNYVCTSEASFLERDATITHTKSYNATKHVSLGMHATTYHVADLPHNSRPIPNHTKTSKSCGSTVHRVDVTRDAYVPLTRQALQQHNTKNTSPDGDKTTRCTLAQNQLIGINLGNPVVHTSILAADYHASAQEYF